MARFPLILLTAAAALVLTGCQGGPAPVPTSTPEAAVTSTPTPTPTPTPEPPTTATLAVCGDVMSHMPVTNDAWDEGTGGYDYTPIFEAARPYVEVADYAVANLETTLSTPDTARLEADLAAARAMDTDLIAVMIHWGIEYQITQNSYQEQLADLLIASGADLVLGGHSHVPQPIEMRTVTADDGTTRTGFVCYSLGNFISSQVDPLTDTTAVLTLELTPDHETGEAGVTDWSYVPMLMVRRDGADRVFTLTDASAIPTGASDSLVQKLEQAVSDCASILGPTPSAP